MRQLFSKMLKCSCGAAGAEFALIVPLFVLLLLGVVDAGRFMWEYNRAEKATQIGARVAIVTDVLSSGLKDEHYDGQTIDETKLGPGSPIPADALGTIKCDQNGCTCEVTPCPADLGTFDSGTFSDVLVTRMQQIDPNIDASNVVVRYSGSGFGFAGNSPSGTGDPMEISPLITVSLVNLQFKPVTALLFAQMAMPDFSTTLTAEDASGQYAD